MKGFLYTIMLSSVVSLSVGQGAMDALNYSQTLHSGSARFVSMGGAFGALGGDFSAISYNPASLGVYRSSEFVFSPSFDYNKVESNFLGTSRDDSRYSFNLNNIGLVSSYKMDEGSPWVNFNFGIGYNKHKTLNSNVLISGFGDVSSMLDEFTINSNNGIEDPFYEDLAYETYLINPDSTGVYDNVINNADYSDYNQFQKHVINKKGAISELILSFGANYNHQLYLGATIGIYSLRFEQNIDHYEEDDWNLMNDFNSFRFKDDFRTTGTGYTVKFGAIYKPVSMLRIGAAFHLPTIYNLEEEYNTSMVSSFDNGDGYSAYSPNGFIEYSLTTPFKFLGSIAFQIEKKGLISLDYEMTDYSTMRFHSDFAEADFDYINQEINETFKMTHNIRAGAEYRANNVFSLRGGFAYYGSPYDNSLKIDESYSIFSAGLGIKDDSFFIDLGYSYTMYSEDYYMYNDSPYLAPAELESSKSKFIATLGFRF